MWASGGESVKHDVMNDWTCLASKEFMNQVEVANVGPRSMFIVCRQISEYRFLH